jgi:hypothetical protein
MLVELGEHAAVRLPLRHPPPTGDVVRRRCTHLEVLAEHALGLPLGAAARVLTGGRSRGRHGIALQWHLGLEAHDGRAEPDWEGRIEIKLVSLWRRGETVLADKVKVCDAALDPRLKLASVLWVFADRATRVVVGHGFTALAGPLREALSAGWDADPHFEDAPIVLEERRTGDLSAPAYYLQASFLREVGIVPRRAPHGVLPFDASWWRGARAQHGGRDPLWTVVTDRAVADEGHAPCPRCGAGVRFDPARLRELGWSPGLHAPSGSPHCLTFGHAVVDAAELPRPRACSVGEQHAALCMTHAAHEVVRLSDRIPEPDDHEH